MPCRACSRRSTTAPSSGHGPAKVSGKIFGRAARTAVAYSEALDRPGGPGLRLRAEHALFDRLVYGKLRAALGGKARYAVSGGAALAERLGHFFRGAGITVLEGYGLTETTAAVSVNRPDRQKIGTVGLPLPGVSVRIADDGEVLIKGKTVFPGYWRNDQASAESFTPDGWYSSGDIGELDDEGFLRITGRKKEIIITAGGKNVSPSVLEDRLRTHALISQCMVVGDGRPYVAALITIDPEAFGPWKEQHGKPADATVADLRDDPDLLADDPGRRGRREQGGLPGRVHQAVPGARRGLHPGAGPPVGEAGHPPFGTGQGVRRRNRRTLLLGTPRPPVNS